MTPRQSSKAREEAKVEDLDVGRPTGSGRELLLAAGEALKPAREIRYRDDADFDDVTEEELEIAERSLRALSYSCQQGASTLLRIRTLRSARRREAARDARETST